MKTLMEIRRDNGVTQKAVAEKLGVTRQTYARYEQQQDQMSIEQAKSVCRFLHCDIADVFLPLKGN